MDQIVLILVLVLCSHFYQSEESGHFNPNRRPKLMGDQLPFKSLSPYRRKIQEKIVNYHNYFRSSVRPYAGNMLKMKWRKDVARSAQRWADECRFLTHDNLTGRYIEDYGACGQNIFIASKQVPWFFAIETWWLEKNDFKFGTKNNLTVVGHYTQLIWAATHEVGCGISKCQYYDNNVDKKEECKDEDGKEKSSGDKKNTAKVYYNYVCNYCPIGNRPKRIGHPYKKGNPCSFCKRDCKKKLCLNSCPVSDFWTNCGRLYKAHPQWLCNTNTGKGKERQEFCRATCTCKHQIHD